MCLWVTSLMSSPRAMSWPWRATIAQGLPSGNFSFQARAVDVAGNVGGVTQSYLFSVNAGLRAPGQPPEKYWGLGWKLWLIVGGGAAVVLAAIASLAAGTALWLKRRKPTSYEPQQNLVVGALRPIPPAPQQEGLSAFPFSSSTAS